MMRLLDFRFNRIGSKIAAIVSLASLVMFGAFTISAYVTGARMLEKQSESKAHAVAGFGKAIVEHLMLEKKSKRIKDVLRTALTFTEIKDAMVFGNDGRLAWDDGNIDSAVHRTISNFIGYPDKPGNRFLTLHEFSRAESLARDDYHIPLLRAEVYRRCGMKEEAQRDEKTIRLYRKAR